MAPAVKAHVFKVRLEGHGAVWRHKARAIVDGVTFALYAEIVGSEEHPVDTGRARAGWAISVYVAGDHLPPEIEVPKVRQRGAAEYPAPMAEIFVAEVTAAPLEAKRVIYNNVHYVIWLEEGTDTREGRHFVKLAIQRLKEGRR
jgi:hypothetical protein